MITENKSYVGMANCFICGEVKHLLLDKRLKNSLPQNAVYDKEPCDKCKEVMKEGIFFIGVKDGQTEEEKENPYRTGQILALKDEAVKKILHGDMLKDVLKKRLCYVEEAVLKQIGLIKEDGKLRFNKK